MVNLAVHIVLKKVAQKPNLIAYIWNRREDENEGREIQVVEAKAIREEQTTRASSTEGAEVQVEAMAIRQETTRPDSIEDKPIQDEGGSGKQGLCLMYFLAFLMNFTP